MLEFTMLSFIYGIYAIPVLLLIIVPNNYIWLGISVFLTAYLYKGILHPELFSSKLFWMICIVYGPGLLLKIYAIREKKRGHVKKARLIPLLGLAGPTVFLLFFQQINNAITPAPPTSQCLTGEFKAEMAGNRFVLSPFALFDIDMGTRKQRTEYAALCNKAARASSPVKVEKIDIAFGKAILRHGDYEDACKKVTKSWQEAVCGRKIWREGRYPKRIRIFKRNTENGNQMPGMVAIDYKSTYENYKKTKNNRSSKVIETISTEEYVLSIIQANPNLEAVVSFWESKNPDLANFEGTPLTLKCHSDLRKSQTFCETMYAYNETISIRYKFLTRLENLPESAIAVEKNVEEIMQDILAGTK